MLLVHPSIAPLMNSPKTVVGIAIAAVCLGCNRSNSPTPQTALPFEYTNFVHEPSAFYNKSRTETVIFFTNQIWFGHQADEISMRRGPSDYDMKVFFNPTNRTVSRTVQSTRIGTNNIMIVDSDGDGVPDSRSNLTTKQGDVLLQGEWAPARGLWSSREALVNSNWILVHFTNGRWRIR
jgi:hypothetical protein